MVCDAVKTTFHQIRDWSLGLGETEETQSEGLHGICGFLSESVTCLSPEQIDILTGENGKTLLNSLVTSIHVYFDAGTAKHRLLVRFSEGIGQVLALRKGCQAGPESSEDPVGGDVALSRPEDGQGFGTRAGEISLRMLDRENCRAALFRHG